MRDQAVVHSVLVVLSIVIVVAILFLTPMEPVQAIPPWRPSLTPKPTSTPQPPPTLQPVTEDKLDGVLIELRAEFPSEWPWYEIHWQDLWTVVQWQNNADSTNPGREWRNVIEWQGTLDYITIDEVDCSNPFCTERDDLVVGYKRWWVSRTDMGKGPFRWRVHGSPAGQVLVTSDLFHLTSTKGIIRRVDVLLPIPDARP